MGGRGGMYGVRGGGWGCNPQVGYCTQGCKVSPFYLGGGVGLGGGAHDGERGGG